MDVPLKPPALIRPFVFTCVENVMSGLRRWFPTTTRSRLISRPYGQALTGDAFIVAMLLHDRFVLGSVHRATAIGSAVNVIPQILHAPLVGSGAWVAFTHWLAGLGYYGA